MLNPYQRGVLQAQRSGPPAPPLTGSGGVSSPKMAVELRVLDQNVVLRVLCVPINVAMSIYTCGDQGAVPRIAHTSRQRLSIIVRRVFRTCIAWPDWDQGSLNVAACLSGVPEWWLGSWRGARGSLPFSYAAHVYFEVILVPSFAPGRPIYAVHWVILRSSRSHRACV